MCQLGRATYRANAARGQRVDVDDQRDPAVAQDRGTGQPLDRLIVRFQALDDDLALILTTEAIVSDKPEKPQSGGSQGGGMGDGGMGGMDF